jgi:hypothetical protein
VPGDWTVADHVHSASLQGPVQMQNFLQNDTVAIFVVI